MYSQQESTETIINNHFIAFIIVCLSNVFIIGGIVTFIYNILINIKHLILTNKLTESAFVTICVILLFVVSYSLCNLLIDSCTKLSEDKITKDEIIREQKFKIKMLEEIIRNQNEKIDELQIDTIQTNSVSWSQVRRQTYEL